MNGLILLIIAITIVILFILITRNYITDFLFEKDLTIGNVRAKNVYVDTLNYRQGYTVSVTPSLSNAVPNPLTDATIDSGGYGASLSGLPGTYILNHNNVRNAVAFQVKVPYGWKSNSPVGVRLHFVPADDTAGNLDLRLWYKTAAIGETYPNDFSNVRINKEVFLNSAGDHLTAIFPSVSLTGKTDQTVIMFAIERQSDGGDSTDTYGAAINIVNVELDFVLSQPGKIV